jgi:hypothetical protein
VFENGAEKIIWIEEGYVTGWRKLHNEELHNFYSSPSIKRMIVMEDEMGRICSTNVEKRNAYRILVGKPEGKI